MGRWLCFFLLLLFGGCQLLVDFDRDAIDADGAVSEENGSSEQSETEPEMAPPPETEQAQDQVPEDPADGGVQTGDGGTEVSNDPN